VVEGRTPLNRLVAMRRLGAWPRDFPRLRPGGTLPFPHDGPDNYEADTHVESHDDVLSDAGSTPAASISLAIARSMSAA
jgi:hypothetical protein